MLSFMPVYAWGQNDGDKEALIDQYSKSVVKVERDQIGDKNEWIGSGVFFTRTRLITNAHVIGSLPDSEETFKEIYTDADIARARFWVSIDGRRYAASVIGRDPELDLAILEVSHPIAGVIPAPLGDSDGVHVGHPVMAVGNPYGMEKTVTEGIVTALEKKNGLLNYERYIQTQAPINPGNSGGPLVSLKTGEVVGIINSGIERADGMGYAIPINLFKAIEKDLLGTVRRAWVGIKFPLEDLKETEGFKGLQMFYMLTGVNDIDVLQSIKKELFPNGGVLVTDVMRALSQSSRDPLIRPPGERHSNGLSDLKSPAHGAGLAIADIIIRFGEYRVQKSADLIYAIFMSRPYEPIRVHVVRFAKSGERIETDITVLPILRPPEGAKAGFY